LDQQAILIFHQALSLKKGGRTGGTEGGREGGREGTYRHDPHQLVVLFDVSDLGVEALIARVAIHQDMARDVAQVVFAVRKRREGGREGGRKSKEYACGHPPGYDPRCRSGRFCCS